MITMRSALFFSSALLLAATSHAEVYTCTTAQGRKITSDRPIPECLDREQRALETTTGRVQIVKPKQTEAERWAEREAQKKAEREREAAMLQQRRDQQLLTRYPDDAALEEKRSYLLGEVRKRWAPTLNEQAEIDKRRKELSAQAQARRNAGKAADFSSAKEAAQLERRTLQLQPMLEKAQAELARVNTEMDADLARLRELRSQAQAARALSLGHGAAVPASAMTQSLQATAVSTPSKGAGR